MGFLSVRVLSGVFVSGFLSCRVFVMDSSDPN